jgi:hypothetical protein
MRWKMFVNAQEVLEWIPPNGKMNVISARIPISVLGLDGIVDIHLIPDLGQQEHGSTRAGSELEILKLALIEAVEWSPTDHMNKLSRKAYIIQTLAKKARRMTLKRLVKKVFTRVPLLHSLR